MHRYVLSQLNGEALPNSVTMWALELLGSHGYLEWVIYMYPA